MLAVEKKYSGEPRLTSDRNLWWTDAGHAGAELTRLTRRASESRRDPDIQLEVGHRAGDADACAGIEL